MKTNLLAQTFSHFTLFSKLCWLNLSNISRLHFTIFTGINLVQATTFALLHHPSKWSPYFYAWLNNPSQSNLTSTRVRTQNPTVAFHLNLCNYKYKGHKVTQVLTSQLSLTYSLSLLFPLLGMFFPAYMHGPTFSPQGFVQIFILDMALPDHFLKYKLFLWF